jgi:hypothetical protein
VGPRAGLDRCVKSRPHRDSIPGPPSSQPVAMVTTLPNPRISKGPRMVLTVYPSVYHMKQKITHISNTNILKSKFVAQEGVTILAQFCKMN